jgi:hypothetical protein
MLLAMENAKPPWRSSVVMELAEIELPMALRAQSGVCGGALNVRRWRIHRTTARTGHA